MTELGALDEEIAFNSGTEIQIEAPPIAESVQEATITPASVPFTIRTLAGESTPAAITYAGVPRVSAVANTASKVRLEGVSGALDSGGTPILLGGKGLLGQVTVVRFPDSAPEASDGSQYTFTPESDTRLSTSTVAQNPALADVEACTVTGCSPSSGGDLLYLYPPGQPAVESLTPHSGSAAGGTETLIRGKNLGCPLAASFASARSPAIHPIATIIYCGATTELRAVAPPGTAGTKVRVTVTTVESYFEGQGDAPSKARFTYESP